MDAEIKRRKFDEEQTICMVSVSLTNCLLVPKEI